MSIENQQSFSISMFFDQKLAMSIIFLTFFHQNFRRKNRKFLPIFEKTSQLAKKLNFLVQNQQKTFFRIKKLLFLTPKSCKYFDQI